jgi:two-component system chemotaxis response regulator CheY
MKAVEGGKFDLILSDVNMPNMNGLDFVKAVKEKLGTPPPIVMITTEGSEEVVKEAMTRGAKGYLKKPFTPEKIQEVIGPFLK